MVKRLLSLCAALIVAIGLFFSPVRSTTETAFASSVENNMDTTSVEDDLGEDFNWLLYPKNPLAEFELLQFVEYCYTDDVAQKGNYALYLYVYNPAELRFSMNNNVVNMAVAYKDGAPSSYENIPLVLCGYTHGDYAFRIYKFRVDVPASVYVNARTSNLANGYRQYDIAGIQLRPMGELLSQDNGVARTFKCSGYAKGYDDTSKTESTYVCEWSDLETVELDVNHTYYRTQTSDKGDGWQHQIDTVYFAVPERFFEKYGFLQRIKAEWYEFVTDEICVTDNKDAYLGAHDCIGIYMEPQAVTGGGIMYKDLCEYGFALNPVFHANGNTTCEWCWNVHMTRNKTDDEQYCEMLKYLFYTPNIDSFDPYDNVDGSVSSSELYQEMIRVSSLIGGQTLSIKEDLLSYDLFEDYIDDSRYMDNERGIIQCGKEGKSIYDFDADLDLQSWQSWEDTNPTFWDNAFSYGLETAWTAIFNGNKIPSESGATIAPIDIIESDDLFLDSTELSLIQKEEISDSLYVHYNDVDELRNFYIQSAKAGKKVVVFHFAVTDYSSQELNIFPYSMGTYTSGNAYLAKQSVFLDFDVIQLTFNGEGEYTVVPVSSDPIDIVNSITPPVKEDPEIDWWKVLLGLLIIVGIIVLIVNFAPALLKTILTWAWKIVSWPFKELGRALKRLFSRRR